MITKGMYSSRFQHWFSLFLLLSMVIVSLPAYFPISIQTTIFLLILYLIILISFSFNHGMQTLGLKSIVVFFCLSFVVTFVMEWFGTHFGIPFGHYYYTNRLGSLFLDVPLSIPFQWFNLLYSCFIMSLILFYGVNNSLNQSLQAYSRGKLFSQSLLVMVVVSLVVGLYMVSWDFLNDPYMVNSGMWVWTNPTEFFGLTLFGIPFSNFLGWVLTSFLVIFLFLLYLSRTTSIAINVPKDGIHLEMLLVMIPYIYLFIFMALNGLTSGIFNLSSGNGFGPIILSFICCAIVSFCTLWGYYKSHSHDS